MPWLPTPVVEYTYRDYRRLDDKAFRHRLATLKSWTSPSDDPDEAAYHLDADLKLALDRHAILRRRRRRLGKRVDWLSQAAIEARCERRRLEKRFERSKSTQDRRAFREACKRTSKLIAESRTTTLQDQINSTKSDPRQLWRTVHSLLHTPVNDSWYQDADTMSLAAGLCHFFVDKVKRVKHSIDASLISVVSPFIPPPYIQPPHALSSFAPVLPCEVMKLIQSAPSKTSPLDVIPISLLKQFGDMISVPIAHIANQSFITGRFPQPLKCGLVTPLLKKPGLDSSDFKNFRPITNLTTVSKILERLVLSRVKSHLTSSPNFCSLQSAYRTSYSTETALVKIIDDILGDIDCGSVVALVSLDISSAFDTVSHVTLLHRLETEFGISGTALAWFTSYLCHRSFSVKVGQSISSAVPLTSGVPQGSVLAPLLYTVYVSPIGRLIDGCNIRYHTYADDTQLYTSIKFPVGDSISRLVGCVESLQTWFWHNNLLLNPDKSDVIFFGTHQRLRSSNLPSSIQIAGNAIHVSSAVKILGVKLDQRLTYRDHVNEVVRACNYHLRALRRIRRYMPMDTARTIAFSIVGSRIDYCNSLLYGVNKESLIQLQRVQNNLARIVCDVRRGQRPSADLLRELHWLPVSARIDFKLALLCCNALKTGQPDYLRAVLKPCMPSRNLRSTDHGLLVISRHNLETARRRFSLAGPSVYNGLPLTVKQSPSVGIFKSTLKTYLFDHDIV